MLVLYSTSTVLVPDTTILSDQDGHGTVLYFLRYHDAELYLLSTHTSTAQLPHMTSIRSWCVRHQHQDLDLRSLVRLLAHVYI